MNKLICPDCGMENDIAENCCTFCNYRFSEVFSASPEPLEPKKKAFVQSKPKNPPKDKSNLMEDKDQELDPEELSYQRPSRIILGVGALLGIFAFFLPFVEINVFVKHSASGFDMLKLVFFAIIDSESEERVIIMSFFEMYKDPNFGTFIITYLLLGPLLFGVFAAHMLMRATEENAEYSPMYLGLVRALVYAVVAFIVLALLGDELGLKLSFFDYVGSGYWLANVSALCASISMLTYHLGKKSVLNRKAI